MKKSLSFPAVIGDYCLIPTDLSPVCFDVVYETKQKNKPNFSTPKIKNQKHITRKKHTIKQKR